MDSEMLRQIILLEESEKLDFKSYLYKISESKPAEQSKVQEWSELREQQWAELVKDILGLANGNVGTASQIGYLVIGVADTPGSNGIRNLLDVGDKLPTRKEILDKVHSYCQHPSLNIHCEKVLLGEAALFVISVLPSPHLYSLKKALKTPKKEYSVHTVLLRRCDGERTYEASTEEQTVIQHEKQVLWMSDSALNNGQADSQDRVQKLSPEVYDRKIAVYRVVHTFLGTIQTKADINLDEIFTFSIGTDEAIFLFDQEVSDYLRTLQVQAGKLYGTSKLLDNSDMPVGDRRTNIAQENMELMIWFESQFQIMRKIFYKHIAL